MRFSFHPEAEEELNQAIDYYEDREPGLGYDFALEVYAAIQPIVKFPKAWGQCLKVKLGGVWLIVIHMGSYIQ